MMLDSKLREIQKRNIDHFKAFGHNSRDPQANDIRDLLEHIEDLIEELTLTAAGAAEY
jgi:hypothetical protein